MTSAYAPLGAVLVPERMVEAFEAESAKLGAFGHGFTYGGHPLGCAVGAKAIEIYQKRDIIGHVQKLAPQFEARLAKLADHPLVGEARGKGLIGGVELVADKATKRPFDAKAGVARPHRQVRRSTRRDLPAHWRHGCPLPADGHHRGGAGPPLRQVGSSAR